MEPNSPEPRWGDGEPEDPVESETVPSKSQHPASVSSSDPARMVFQFDVTQGPIDYLLIRYGLLPTEDLRLTVATELHNKSSIWLEEVVRLLAAKITSSG